MAELLSVSESLSALVDSSSVRVVFFKGDLKKPILTLKSSAADANATEFRLFFGVCLCVTFLLLQVLYVIYSLTIHIIFLRFLPICSSYLVCYQIKTISHKYATVQTWRKTAARPVSFAVAPLSNTT